MKARVFLLLIFICCLHNGATFEELPNARQSRSPQMPPTIAALRPPKRRPPKDDLHEDNIEISQKNSDAYPYMTRYSYKESSGNEKVQYERTKSNPISPYFAARLPPKRKPKPTTTEPPKSEKLPPKIFFPKSKKSPRNSILKQSLSHRKISINRQNSKPAGSYKNVLFKLNLSDKQVKVILKKKGVIFEEFLNFIERGASMDQIEQILYLAELDKMRQIKKSDTYSDTHGKRRFKYENRLNTIAKNVRSNNNINRFVDLPAKDSPMIAHFRVPQTKPPPKKSASILSLSIEEKKIAKKNTEAITKNEKKLLKIDPNIQSDQAQESPQKKYKFEDWLQLFLLVCGGIGGIVLLVTIVLVIYNILTCKESRMVHNYELTKHVRETDESIEIS